MESSRSLRLASFSSFNHSLTCRHSFGIRDSQTVCAHIHNTLTTSPILPTWMIDDSLSAHRESRHYIPERIEDDVCFDTVMQW